MPVSRRRRRRRRRRARLPRLQPLLLPLLPLQGAALQQLAEAQRARRRRRRRAQSPSPAAPCRPRQRAALLCSPQSCLPLPQAAAVARPPLRQALLSLLSLAQQEQGRSAAPAACPLESTLLWLPAGSASGTLAMCTALSLAASGWQLRSCWRCWLPGRAALRQWPGCHCRQPMQQQLQLQLPVLLQLLCPRALQRTLWRRQSWGRQQSCSMWLQRCLQQCLPPPPPPPSPLASAPPPCTPAPLRE